MADCVYCGKPAGIFRWEHKECATQRKLEIAERASADALVADVVNQVRSELGPLLHSEVPLQDLVSNVDAVVRERGLKDDRRKEVLVAACSAMIDGALEDDLLSEEEELRILGFMAACGVNREDLPDQSVWSMLVKMAVLRDVMSGINPSRLSVDGAPSVNFQKGESLIWAFPGADYLEDRSRVQYQGGSQGISLRIMKGVYYRVGAFKGERTVSTERKFVDSGWVFITDRNLYFAGDNKSLRVPYAKIVSFQPFSDGIGFIRDAATAKPQIFRTGDGWFAYNLVTNLASR